MSLKQILPAATLSILAMGFAEAAETVIAFDMVDSASLNLTSYDNAYTGAFGSAADGFQKYQHGVSSSIPFAVLDDTTTFSSDSIGVVNSANTEAFFGVVDTQNGDNNGDVIASWVFDVSGATGLGLQIDMGAMDDFENSDVFKLTASIDGAPAVEIFNIVADESASLTYTLETGKNVTLSDPLTIPGKVLSNILSPARAAIPGNGSQLTLSLIANANGGSEAFVLQNLKVLSDFSAEPPVGPELLPISVIQGSSRCAVYCVKPSSRC